MLKRCFPILVATNQTSTILTWVCQHTTPSCIPEQPVCPAGSASCGRWTGTERCSYCCPEGAAARWASSAQLLWQAWFCERRGLRALQAAARSDSPDKTSCHPVGGRQTLWTCETKKSQSRFSWSKKDDLSPASKRSGCLSSHLLQYSCWVNGGLRDRFSASLAKSLASDTCKAKRFIVFN